jgi:hypothetical protein
MITLRKIKGNFVKGNFLKRLPSGGLFYGVVGP